MAFTGFVRRDDGSVVKQEADSRAEAETWVSEMIRAEVSAKRNLVEAGLMAKKKTSRKRTPAKAAKRAKPGKKTAAVRKRTSKRKTDPVEGLGTDPRSGEPMTPRLRGRM